jgi:hypothetical protein
VWDRELMSEDTLNNKETQAKPGFLLVDDIGLEMDRFHQVRMRSAA